MTDHLTNDRKLEHISVILNDEQTDRAKHYFDRIHLVHRALPEVNLDEIDPSIEFMGKKLSFPLLISSMTGGSQEKVMVINRNLATAAQTCGVAMGVGSQRVMFTHPEARPSFELRPFAPNALLFANLGAVQLNYGFTIDHCRRAVEAVAADALYLHLNPLQEAVQPEGNVDFSGLAAKIGAVARDLEVPVIVKEVGAGISPADANLLAAQGIRYIDVSGSGGTSWSRIEHFRRQEEADDLGLLFQDWGNPTPLALYALRPLTDRVTLVASGGIRSGIDMVKAVILGASLCGLAKPFLKPAMESAEAVIRVIERLKKEFVVAMFLLGVSNTDQLKKNDSLLWNPDFARL
ncbi:MAG: type 2 isopentenyl-diphosphate Delta-isomerase [candidate division KSB1 bacterium]|nr:type 2 isopentenyl-diphosphate Delta-isomerase [candidate division KSB1 bacterium]MDZ7345506.1 type 2 isopentenyl-diphosphate Delta-isomerase [candidate division KSB1 bacterium]